MLRDRPKRGLRDDGEDKDDELNKLIADSEVEGVEKLARIRRLINAARARATPLFRYVCEMAIRPHAVTWKEFEILFSEWRADQRPEVLQKWINDHSSRHHVSVEDVESELFESIVNRRLGNLQAAAEFVSILEQESKRNGCVASMANGGAVFGWPQKVGRIDLQKTIWTSFCLDWISEKSKRQDTARRRGSATRQAVDISLIGVVDRIV